MMQTNPASGVASAHRYNLAPSSMTIFKTRIKPCRIAVRADIQNSLPSKNKQRRFAAIRQPHFGDLNQIQSSEAMPLRFTDYWHLKADDLQRSSALLFPYVAGRRHSNGLLEQMPRSRDRRASARLARSARAHSAPPSNSRRGIRTHSRSQSSISSSPFPMRLRD